jgi:ADP-ribosylglycohydrolase
LGGDTDTIAALVGGLSGIYYGWCSIPDNWIQNILKKKEIANIVNEYFRFVTA